MQYEQAPFLLMKYALKLRMVKFGFYIQDDNILRLLDLALEIDNWSKYVSNNYKKEIPEIVFTMIKSAFKVFFTESTKSVAIR